MGKKIPPKERKGKPPSGLQVAAEFDVAPIIAGTQKAVASFNELGTAVRNQAAMFIGPAAVATPAVAVPKIRMPERWKLNIPTLAGQEDRIADKVVRRLKPEPLLPLKLTPHEKRIRSWVLLPLAQYCRELTRQGIRPRKAWLESRPPCPPTYTEAYGNRYWRQRVKNEWNRLRRKLNGVEKCRDTE